MGEATTPPPTARRLVASAFVGAFISSGVVIFIAEQVSARRTERVVQEVRAEFGRQQQIDAWKKESLSSLVAPVVMQLDRTRRAFVRYKANARFIEHEIMYKANLAVRDLLLANGHLIPAELRDVSGRLIEHYDSWLEEYDRVRGTQARAPNEPFVFAGPQGYEFPKDADRLFKAAFDRLWAELYASSTTQTASR